MRNAIALLRALFLSDRGVLDGSGLRNSVKSGQSLRVEGSWRKFHQSRRLLQGAYHLLSYMSAMLASEGFHLPDSVWDCSNVDLCLSSDMVERQTQTWQLTFSFSSTVARLG